MGLAGLGDLVLTCTGDLSRNRRFGLALGRGVSIDPPRLPKSVRSSMSVTVDEVMRLAATRKRGTADQLAGATRVARGDHAGASHASVDRTRTEIGILMALPTIDAKRFGERFGRRQEAQASCAECGTRVERAPCPRGDVALVCWSALHDGSLRSLHAPFRARSARRRGVRNPGEVVASTGASQTPIKPPKGEPPRGYWHAPVNPICRQASNTVTATALERFKLRLPSRIGSRSRCCAGSASSTACGKPRVSGPNSNASLAV